MGIIIPFRQIKQKAREKRERQGVKSYAWNHICRKWQRLKSETGLFVTKRHAYVWIGSLSTADLTVAACQLWKRQPRNVSHLFPIYFICLIPRSLCSIFPVNFKIRSWYYYSAASLSFFHFLLFLFILSNFEDQIQSF